jgi:RNA polymerase sigma-70 factor (ECF subfamily)
LDRLLRGFQQGDRDAFAELARRYQASVFRFTCSILRNREDARDATQEALLRAWSQRRRYDRTRPFEGWLFGIAANLTRDLLRRRRRSSLGFHAMSPRPAGIGTSAPDAPPDRELMQRDLRAALEAVIRALPFEYRSVLILREVEGLSYAEIAEVLGCSVGTVRSRLSRARQGARRLLAPFLEGGEAG